MEKLKPCPFCGGDAHIAERVTYGGKMYGVSCSTPLCPGSEPGPWCLDADAAVYWWNHRAERTCRMDPPIGGEYRCSECGHLSKDTYRYDSGWHSPMYCPHCGAKVIG